MDFDIGNLILIPNQMLVLHITVDLLEMFITNRIFTGINLKQIMMLKFNKLLLNLVNPALLHIYTMCYFRHSN